MQKLIELWKKKWDGDKRILKDNKIVIAWNPNITTLTIWNLIWLDWVSLSTFREEEMDFQDTLNKRLLWVGLRFTHLIQTNLFVNAIILVRQKKSVVMLILLFLYCFLNINTKMLF